MNVNRVRVVISGGVLWAIFALYNLYNDYGSDQILSTDHTPFTDIIFSMLPVALIGVITAGITMFLVGTKSFFEWMDIDD